MPTFICWVPFAWTYLRCSIKPIHQEIVLLYCWSFIIYGLCLLLSLQCYLRRRIILVNEYFNIIFLLIVLLSGCCRLVVLLGFFDGNQNPCSWNCTCLLSGIIAKIKRRPSTPKLRDGVIISYIITVNTIFSYIF